MKWYYLTQSSDQVSFPEEVLPGLVDSGRLEAGTLVWHEGLVDWTPLEELNPHLFSAESGDAEKSPAPLPLTTVCQECGATNQLSALENWAQCWLCFKDLDFRPDIQAANPREGRRPVILQTEAPQQNEKGVPITGIAVLAAVVLLLLSSASKEPGFAIFFGIVLAPTFVIALLEVCNIQKATRPGLALSGKVLLWTLLGIIVVPTAVVIFLFAICLGGLKLLGH